MAEGCGPHRAVAAVAHSALRFSFSFPKMSSSSSSYPDVGGRLVLVTGVTGYIASHIVQQLLNLNYRVRGTVRSLKNTSITTHFNSFPHAAERLEFVEADLANDDSWPQAVKGCDFIIHTASPCMLESRVKDVEKELIQPAVQGTLSVLRGAAASKGAVKRVILTSSVASIIEGHMKDPKYTPDYLYQESDFSDLNGFMDGYCRSKTRAELAAWEFVKGLSAEEKFEFCTVNPSMVMGPILSSKSSGSAELIVRFLTKSEPKPHISTPTVDVRDVASVHIRAMTAPAEKIEGRRFICADANVGLIEIAQVLTKEFNHQGYSVSTSSVPNWLMGIAGWFNKEAAGVKYMLGRITNVDKSKTEETLGIKFRPWQEAILEMAYSVIQLGLVPDKRKNGKNEKKKGGEEKKEAEQGEEKKAE